MIGFYLDNLLSGQSPSDEATKITHVNKKKNVFISLMFDFQAWFNQTIDALRVANILAMYKVDQNKA